MSGIFFLIRRPTTRSPECICMNARRAFAYKQLSKSFHKTATRHHEKIVLGKPSSTTKLNKKHLPNTPARTRFAPSPTGFLHLGSLRTALYNYLLAKATGGQFIIRLEDTDRTRLVPDAEQRLYDDLRWAGLSWDEGPDIGGEFGPYKQSDRLETYDTHVNSLIKDGKAYRCFCKPEDLDRVKQESTEGAGAHYPGTCRSLSPEESEERSSAGETYSVRFISRKPPTEPREIKDIVYGRYRKAEYEDDFIIRKRDGFPTYHFANVVDDKLMGITHVIRGAEWLISTPKHVELYDAFSWEAPEFAHVGLLVDENRQKLSKRHAGVNMDWYRERAIPPQALLNFAVLHGWHRPGVKNEVMTLQDMVDGFGLKFSKGDIIVDFGKMDFLRFQHQKRLVHQKPPDWPRLTEQIFMPLEAAIKRGHKTTERKTEPDRLVPALSFLTDVADTVNEQSQRQGREYLLATAQLGKSPINFESFVRNHRGLFWQTPRDYLSPNIATQMQQADFLGEDGKIHQLINLLLFARTQLSMIEDWTATNINQALLQLVGRECLWSSNKKLLNADGYKFLYWALLWTDRGPSIAGLIELLGKQETLLRLETLGTWADKYQMGQVKAEQQDSPEATGGTPSSPEDSETGQNDK